MPSGEVSKQLEFILWLLMHKLKWWLRWSAKTLLSKKMYHLCITFSNSKVRMKWILRQEWLGIERRTIQEVRRPLLFIYNNIYIYLLLNIYVCVCIYILKSYVKYKNSEGKEKWTPELYLLKFSLMCCGRWSWHPERG